MADTTFAPKVYKKHGATELIVAAGGKITIETGGAIILPTADPAIAGALWNNSGTITVSAG
jgi:hypothetical protein